MRMTLSVPEIDTHDLRSVGQRSTAERWAAGIDHEEIAVGRTVQRIDINEGRGGGFAGTPVVPGHIRKRRSPTLPVEQRQLRAAGARPARATDKDAAPV